MEATQHFKSSKLYIRQISRNIISKCLAVLWGKFMDH